jgi:hypothetical protein
MARLFPQLLAEIGQRSADELSAMTVAEASRRADGRLQDPSSIAVFSATGGTRVTPEELFDLRKAVLAKAREQGFPGSSRREAQGCDAPVAVVLRDRMNMTASEASIPGIWEYLACVLMPDFVVWRHQENGRTSTDRFLSGGRRRNSFHRLWWRAYVLAGNLRSEEAVRLLAFPTEDDMVQTLERPGLFGNLRVMRLYYAEFKKAVDGGQLGAPREAINRDVHKRLLRVAAVRALEALPDGALQSELRELIKQASTSIARAQDSR